MSTKLKQSLVFLQFVANSKNKQLKNLLMKELGKDNQTFSSLKEIIANTLNHNIPLPIKQQKLLRKYKKTLEKFVKPNLSRKEKRKLVVQSGGYLHILLPVVTSFLTSLLKK